MNFVMCLNEETKTKMLQSNYTFLHSKDVDGKTIHVFRNNGKLQFEKKDVIYTDVMTF